MKNNKIYEDLSLIRRRAQIAYGAFIGLFAVLLLSFWKIQILDYQKFWKKSEANRIRKMPIPPRRGLIVDRNGRILAKNIASFKASFIRENCEDREESIQKIAEILCLEPDILKARIEKYKTAPLFQPIVVKDDLSHKEVARIEARKHEMPELILQMEARRNYPHGSFASHVLGYLQEIAPEEMRLAPYKERRLGDLIGKTGIEKQYDGLLTGTEGELLEIVDSMGRKIEEISRAHPVKGMDALLTLDFDIQKKAEELLEGREGAVVVMNPGTGEIIAMASFPTYDPNKFINRFSPEEWVDLLNSPEHPLENRAIRGLYSPGSVFKLSMALAGLDMHVVNERTEFSCNGGTIIYGHPFSCWKGDGHGSVDVYSAVEHSCNIYFYQLGKRIGIQDISRYARMLGFGRRTQIDIPGEKSGLVPDPVWKQNVKKEPWYPGETISVSIGQGPLLVTPLQVALHTAIIANRGARVVPHLLKKERYPFLKERKENSIEGRANIKISQPSFEKVIRGMWLAVNRNGTARAAGVRDFDVCGKTGSAQVISRETAEKLAQKKREFQTHSWFTGFAPKDIPEVVVTLIVEFGGGGGATAAPLAGELFDLFRKKYD